MVSSQELREKYDNEKRKYPKVTPNTPAARQPTRRDDDFDDEPSEGVPPVMTKPSLPARARIVPNTSAARNQSMQITANSAAQLAQSRSERIQPNTPSAQAQRAPSSARIQPNTAAQKAANAGEPAQRAAPLPRPARPEGRPAPQAGTMPQVIKRVVSERRNEAPEERDEFVSRRKMMLKAQQLPQGDDKCAMCRSRNSSPTQSTYFVMNWEGRPVAKGHATIFPKRHVRSYFDLNAEEAADMHSLIKTTKKMIDSQHRPDGYNIGVDDGEWAGQTDDHLIIHVIPRYKGDVISPTLGIRKILPKRFD